MIITKKKIIQIFSDGSLNFSSTLLKKEKKVKIGYKDHTTFTWNKKHLTSTLDSNDFKSFKTKYFKV